MTAIITLRTIFICLIIVCLFSCGVENYVIVNKTEIENKF